ncbi:IMPACT family protein [Bacteroidota bacterium]
MTTFTETRFKEKGSQFIGQAYPVTDETEALEILESVRKKYYDATHHCYCYDIFRGVNKYSDDGEPSGTAGIRIFNAIKHFELTNLLVVSIRYYGGTKLGVGPLGKAYYRSAFETLEAAPAIEKIKHVKVKITFDYELTSSIHHTVSLFEAANIQNIFETKPSIECCIRSIQFDKFQSSLRESSKGKAEIKVLEDSVFLNLT